MSALLQRLTILALILSSLSGISLAQSDDTCPVSQFAGNVLDGVVTPGDANNVRAEPSADAEIVGGAFPGVAFDVISPDAVCADGFLWINIRTREVTGWTVERPMDGGEPYVVPYEPDIRVVGVPDEDGTIHVEDSGIAFTVPAGLGVVEVQIVPRVGSFGEVMSAQPSSVEFHLLDDEGELAGRLQILPSERDPEAGADYYRDLISLLEERPPLIEYFVGHQIPYWPQAGAAALFAGAAQYLSSETFDGVRFLTDFAQMYVVFDPDVRPVVFEYLYRGITQDTVFVIAANDFAVVPPQDAIPAPVVPSEEQYFRYIRALEANLAALPTDAFTPDLALIDAIFASLTITDNDAVFEVIP